ncbi:uncharacterized protein (TIGR02302 family) [Rubricella aquisinus]|uniref:Uncharacterized protein (TIGR02302 family) n=1 Tax=Rubricella aquisinus TaxID=2028108 RepID=A0A840X2F8_9RHOB|nr:TIGR02302 family protein [Rubricella aquisinus]MBB5516036.1 uncharacterized protein (TIGR02302 family) [Rubricella aquisinus]
MSAADHLTSTAQARISAAVTRTRLAMMAERGTRAFWPVWTILFFAISVESFGLLAGVSAPVFIGLHAVLILALVVFLVSGVRSYRHPSRAEARARLDADLPGRPLATLEDRPIIGADDAGAQAVWIAHLERMARAAERAKATAPDLRLSDRDPFALRLLAVVAIVTALLFSRGPSFEAVAPALTASGPQISAGPDFEGWATPPAYTGLPTLYLPDLTTGAPIPLPQGSEITLRLYGDADPTLEQSVTPDTVELAERGIGIRDATFTAVQSGIVALPGREDAARWQFTISPDAPPVATFDEAVRRSTGGSTEVIFSASDDFAVQQVTATVTLDLDAVERRYGLTADPDPMEPLQIDLPLPLSGDRDAFTETLVEDFSTHPLASHPVIITLEATDGAGQTSQPEVTQAVLPQRLFFDPVAAAVVEMRRDLLWAEANAKRVSQVLRATTHMPEDLNLPSGAYLALRSAITRLDLARLDDRVAVERDAIAAQLWDVALMIEDGALSDAQERLRRAQERLSEALESDASDEEIAQLMDELRDAMENYMEQMAREMMENPDRQQAQNMPEGPTMDGQDLQELLDQIQDLSEAGEREMAQAMLDQLAQMMENMQMQMAEGQNGQPQPGQGGTQEGLQDMLREQQNLADESFREMQREFRERMGQGQQPGQQPQPGEPQQGQGGDNPQSLGDGLGSLAERQEALREMLEGLRSQLPGDAEGEEGEAGRRALEDAEENMADATDALRNEDGGRALDQQAQAMENLREAMRQLSNEARQQAQNDQERNGTGQAMDDPNGQRDPLGRPVGAQGALDGRGTDLPDADAIGRSRALLDELRRRAGEQNRSVEERDYLRRLLERF